MNTAASPGRATRLDLAFRQRTNRSRPTLLDRATVVTEGELADFDDRLAATYAELGVIPGVVVASAFFDDLMSCAVAASSIAHCTYAPLNRALRRNQAATAYRRLGARALVLYEGDRSNGAVSEAQALGMAVIRVGWQSGTSLDAATIWIESIGEPSPASYSPDDQLVLHTSGTTGQPRLVPLSGTNLSASTTNMATAFKLTEADRSLAVMPLFHVHALVASVLLPLSVGGSVATTGTYDAPSFLADLNHLSPTYYSAVPAVHASVLKRTADHPDELQTHDLRFVRSSSAHLDSATQVGLGVALGVPVLQGYAMTECTSQVTSNPLPPAAAKIGSVGQSVGPVISILDDDGVACAANTTGTVAIGGPTVVAGYKNDPESTAAAFVDGAHLTSDLGYLDDDGYLFLVGRRNDLIRRGGEAISPRQVEDALIEHPAVVQALVFAVPDARLGEQVGALVVAADEQTSSDDLEMALREHVFTKLPVVSVPRRIIVVDEIPLGPMGKPLRTGIAERYGLRDLDDREHSGATIEPRTPTEAKLVELWEAALATTVASVTRDLFSLGGDSLLAKSLMFTVQAEFDVEFTMLEFFSALTVAEQATLVDTKLAAGATATSDDDLAIESFAVADPFPLSSAQERMWVLHEIDPARLEYLVPLHMSFQGAVDADRVEAALTLVVQRHEPLRTRVVGFVGDAAMQQIDPNVSFRLDRASAPGYDEAAALIAQHQHRPFDLGAALKIRALLVVTPTASHLALTTHHIAIDGGSLRILRRELLDGLRPEPNRAPAAKPLTASYRDAVAHERAMRRRPDWDDDVEAWRTRFDPLPATLPLPYDIAPSNAGPRRGKTASIDLAGTSRSNLDEVARRYRATPFMVVLAAKAQALHAITGATDIVIGTPSEDRSWPPAAPLIGLFVNTLALRLDLSGDPSIEELVARCRHVSLDAYRRAHIPFDDVVDAVQPERSPYHPPLFQTMLAFGALPASTHELDGAGARPATFVEAGAHFDLTTSVFVSDTDMRANIVADASRFAAATVDHMATTFGDALRSALS